MKINCILIVLISVIFIETNQGQNEIISEILYETKNNNIWVYSRKEIYTYKDLNIEKVILFWNDGKWLNSQKVLKRIIPDVDSTVIEVFQWIDSSFVKPPEMPMYPVSYGPEIIESMEKQKKETQLLPYFFPRLRHLIEKEFRENNLLLNTIELNIKGDLEREKAILKYDKKGRVNSLQSEDFRIIIVYLN